MDEKIKFHPTTDLSDAYGDKVQHMTLPMQDFGAVRQFAGRIRTAVTMQDTKLAQDALFATPGHGDVIILDGGGSLKTAMLGDRMAARLISNGWAGIIINGAVRDSAELAHLQIGIKALGTTPIRSAKKGIGALDVPVAFGEVLFESAQYVYSDEDGVIVSDEPLVLP